MFKVFFNLSLISGSKVHRALIQEVDCKYTLMEAMNQYLEKTFGIDNEWCRLTFGSFSCKPGEIVFNYVGFIPDRLSYLVDDSFTDMGDE